jgi:hypothetical protein
MHQNLVKKAEGMWTLDTPRHRCEDNIKTDVKVIGWDGINWIHDTVQQQALVNMVINHWIP